MYYFSTGDDVVHRNVCVIITLFIFVYSFREFIRNSKSYQNETDIKLPDTQITLI